MDLLFEVLDFLFADRGHWIISVILLVIALFCVMILIMLGKNELVDFLNTEATHWSIICILYWWSICLVILFWEPKRRS